MAAVFHWYTSSFNLSKIYLLFLSKSRRNKFINDSSLGNKFTFIDLNYNSSKGHELLNKIIAVFEGSDVHSRVLFINSFSEVCA